MKYLYTLIVTLFLAVPAYSATTTNASTNQPSILEEATKTAKAAVATNLNEVIVDILRGVKSAGGEVYQASKSAIGKSVDFAMEQAPLVVKEFLRWMVAKSVLNILICALVSGLLFYLSKKAAGFMKTCRDGSDEEFFGWAIKWITRLAAVIVLIVSIGINGKVITKVLVAPRVYLIEYVADTLHGTNNR